MNIDLEKNWRAILAWLILSTVFFGMPTAYGAMANLADLNVKDFGAIGNGIADDTDAINRALAAVATQKKSLYIPPGIYRCDKMDANNHMLSLNGGGLDNITIYGDGESSHITTSVSNSSTLLYVWAYAKNHNFSISGLKFSSTHAPATQVYQNGLFLQGTGGANFETAAIRDNVFSGFGNTIGAQGVNGFQISDNTFLSPRGHDDSQGSTAPAVYIWMHDNANGLCRNVSILNNVATGYSGSAKIGSLVTKRPMDGFVYGVAYGITISGNSTTNFSEEHYALAAPITYPASTAPVLIADNIINGVIPTGSFAQDGSAKLSNYGIRSEASYVTINNNTMTNMTLGILVRTFDQPLIKARSIKILNNTIDMAKDSLNYAVTSGIYVIGSPANNVDSVQVSGNTINAYFKSPTNYNAVRLIYTNGATVTDNTVQLLETPIGMIASGKAFNYQFTKRVIHRNNTVIGPLIAVTGLSPPVVPPGILGLLLL
ncbi:MAG: glycosyl hydrolase family 28-related protein [Pseudomonadota bacterium]